MAQTYTLEEAAQRLSLTVEEFKRRLRTEWTSVRSFRDGPTLRFRSAEIDELARTLGESSDAGLQLGGGQPLSDPDSDETPILTLDDDPPVPVKPPSSKKKKKPVEEPLLLDDGTDEDTIFTLPTGDSGVGKKKPKPAAGSDSDVRLDLASRVQDPNDHQLTEEIVLDLEQPLRGGSGVLKSPSSVRLTGQGSAKLKAPSSNKVSPPSSPRIGGPASAKIPGPNPGAEEGSSEFELTLDSDSDSFELNLNDSSEEVILGEELSEDRGGQSGINLGKPSDSGVSLEKKKSKSKPQLDDESDIDFELTLDAPGESGKRLVGPKSARNVVSSDSEFELTLDDNSGVADAITDELAEEQSQGDIFETDFELPAVSEDDSGSEVIAIDSADTDLENSDFDIAIDAGDAPIDDESASQVVLMDDEPAEVLSDDGAELVEEAEEETPQSRKSGKRRRQAVLDADDEDGGVAVAEEDEESGNWASATKKGGETDDDDEPVRGGYVAPPRWGPLPAILLLPCLVIVLIGGMMAFEMIRGQVGYQQPNKPSDVLVRGMAKQFGFKTGD